MRAVFRHELHTYFTTPIGYIFLIMYTLLAGIVFVFININQEMSASMNLTLSGLQLPFMLIAPLLTMRLFAEERRMRTDQLLFTSPVRVSSVVLGKQLAAVLMLIIAMGLTAFIPCLMARWAQISARQIATVYLGYFLLDTSMLALGLWISSMCINQVTAAIITLGVNLLLYLGEHYILPQLSSGQLVPVRLMLEWLPSSARLGDFANGIISLADVVYFAAFTALMLLFTCRVIERRRFAKG